MVYLLIAAFLWGTSFIAGKFAYQVADPVLVVAFRLVIASLVTLLVSLRFLKTRSALLTASDWRLLAVLGLMTYPLTFGLQFVGLNLTSASSATTVLGILPIMVALVGWVFFGDRPSLSVLVLGLLAFLGVGLLVSSGGGAVDLWGCFLVFLSTVVVAFWLRLSQRLMAKIGPTDYTALSLQLGTLLGLPLLVLMADDPTLGKEPVGWAAIAYLGVGCSLLAGWAWNQGLQRTDSNISGIFLALEPVFGVLLAVLLLGERLTWLSVLGVCLVLGASLISVFGQKRAA